MDLQLMILFLSVGLTSCEIFTATAQLRLLASQEQNFVAAMQELVDQEQDNQTMLNVKRTLNELRKTSPRRQRDLDHPLTVYKMIKRWRTVLVGLGDTQELRMKCHKLGIPVVTNDDLVGAMVALIRLQWTYALPTVEMYHGIVYGVKAEPLSPDDAYELGHAALEIEDYKYAVEWLKIAGMADQTTASYSVAHANFELAKIHYDFGDYGTAAAVIQKAIALAPSNETLKLYVKVYNKRNESQYTDNEGKPYDTVAAWKRKMPAWKEEYERMCRGEMYPQNSKSARRQFCRYRKTRVPFYQVKEEVFSVQPWIAQLHEVIHPSEIRKIKELALPQLQRAAIHNTAGLLPSEIRVSKVAWLWDAAEDAEDAFISMMSLRVSLITGCDTTIRSARTSAEPFQVVNYGIGGQYEPHFDYHPSLHGITLPEILRGSGERLATFLFYLSTTKAGGATVFPRVNVRVPAVAGSAAFWFNIKKNGEPDPNTMHAGCPVLLGEKWVANKWIREFGQEFRRLCGLKYNAKENGYCKM